jgi:hypothetical protein
LRIEAPLLKKCWVWKCLAEKPPYRAKPGGGRSCGPPLPYRVAPPVATFSSMCSVAPRPQGRHNFRRDGRRLASAMPWRCFPAVCRELQRPPPTQIRPYPRRRHFFGDTCPVLEHESVQGVNSAAKKYSTSAEREILALVYIYYFKSHPYMAFPDTY